MFPKIGERLSNNAILLASRKIEDAVPGFQMETHAVLAYSFGSGYVTWMGYLDSNGRNSCGTGHYFHDDIVAAAKDYAKRAKLEQVPESLQRLV